MPSSGALQLQAMGIAVELGPEGVARCVREAGVGFMFAPRFHPAMAAVVPVRRSLKVRAWLTTLLYTPLTRLSIGVYGIVTYCMPWLPP